MSAANEIVLGDIEEVAKYVAQLVREGIVYEAGWDIRGYWVRTNGEF